MSVTRQRRSQSGNAPNLSALNEAAAQPINTQKIIDLEKKLIEDLIKSNYNQGQCPAESILSAKKESENRLNALNDANIEYFEHLSGKCVCTRCTCGRHRCQQTKLTQQQNQLPQSLYQDSYLGSQVSAKQQLIKYPNNLNIKNDLKMEVKTTHKYFFTPKSSEGRGASLKRKDNITIGFIPGESETSYKNAHTSKMYSKPLLILPTQNLTVVHNSHFNGKSEMQSQFSPEKLALFTPVRKGDIIMKSSGVNMGADQSKSPNFYKSTYTKGYTQFPISQNEKDLINSLKSISQSPHTFPGQNMYIPTSTQRDSYRENLRKICPIIIERTRGLSAYAPYDDRSNNNNNNKSLIV